MASEDRVEIWTDGGCKPNPGPGGWAAILRFRGVEKELSGGDTATTNNRMELTAAAAALEALNRPSRVVVHTDSEYVKNGITRWMTGWVRKNWRGASGDPVKNLDLWQRLLAAEKPHEVEWKWVRGHNGDEMNERADLLATEARERDWLARLRLRVVGMNKTRWLVLIVLGAAIGVTTGTLAQTNRNEQTGDRGSYAPIVLQIACGGMAKPTCVKVVPRIAARTGQAGIDLKASGSGLALDTAAAVCEGEAAGAVVQRDALALIMRLPSCTGRYDIIGRPLYPWYAFLVVKAGSPFQEFGDMAGKRLVVTGSPGSSGQIALGFLLRSDAALQRSVAVSMGDPDIAVAQVANGSAAGYFVLDTLDSDLIQRIRQAIDAHRKPLYAFIDIRPRPELFQIGDGAGHCLFRLTALDFGGANPVTTVSEDAVMILARASRDAHAKGGPRASDALAAAIDAVEPGILADMKSPGDWRPSGTACQ